MPKMSPFPGPNSVLVLDNASIHLKVELRRLIEGGLGGVVEFLPPYSPDYNPIEKTWGSCKTWLRHNTALAAVLDPYRCIELAMASITPRACAAWIQYVPFYNTP